jgi:hypothetical protein
MHNARDLYLVLLMQVQPLRLKSSSTPLFPSWLNVKDSSGMIGKLDMTVAKQIGHLSAGSLVLSKNVAHQ